MPPLCFFCEQVLQRMQAEGCRMKGKLFSLNVNVRNVNVRRP